MSPAQTQVIFILPTHNLWFWLQPTHNSGNLHSTNPHLLIPTVTSSILGNLHSTNTELVILTATSLNSENLYSTNPQLVILTAINSPLRKSPFLPNHNWWFWLPPAHHSVNLHSSKPQLVILTATSSISGNIYSTNLHWWFWLPPTRNSGSPYFTNPQLVVLNATNSQLRKSLFYQLTTGVSDCHQLTTQEVFILPTHNWWFWLPPTQTQEIAILPTHNWWFWLPPTHTQVIFILPNHNLWFWLPPTHSWGNLYSTKPQLMILTATNSQLRKSLLKQLTTGDSDCHQLKLR